MKVADLCALTYFCSPIKEWLEDETREDAMNRNGKIGKAMILVGIAFAIVLSAASLDARKISQNNKYAAGGETSSRVQTTGISTTKEALEKLRALEVWPTQYVRTLQDLREALQNLRIVPQSGTVVPSFDSSDDQASCTSRYQQCGRDIYGVSASSTQADQACALLNMNRQNEGDLCWGWRLLCQYANGTTGDGQTGVPAAKGEIRRLLRCSSCPASVNCAENPLFSILQNPGRLALIMSLMQPLSGANDLGALLSDQARVNHFLACLIAPETTQCR